MTVRCGQPCLQAAENTLLPCITAAVGEAMACEYKMPKLMLSYRYDAKMIVSCFHA